MRTNVLAGASTGVSGSVPEKNTHRFAERNADLKSTGLGSTINKSEHILRQRSKRDGIENVNDYLIDDGVNGRLALKYVAALDRTGRPDSSEYTSRLLDPLIMSFEGES